MDPKLVDLIQHIAETLGLAVVHLWPEMVLRFWIQSLISAIIDLILIVVGSFTSVYVIKACARYRRSQAEAYESAVLNAKPYYPVNQGDYDPTGWMIVAGFVVIACGLLVLMGFSYISTDLSNVIVPEAGLTMKLLGK